MQDLDKICGWKVLTDKGKEQGKNYLSKPLFICAYNCKGYNKNCGGYYPYKPKEVLTALSSPHK